ncbi:hypothetical protein [Streptomyces sp. NPDC090026]|uniref:hypothetical protein n=1 Tax=Streptomyces sp. NPDC090026 TaxID=3365923 RepID=UPI003807ED3C
MIDQGQDKGHDQDQEWSARRRRAGIAAFAAGFALALAFFVFWPGLPHVIDAGALVVSLLVGGLTRWACQAWMTKQHTGTR